MWYDSDKINKDIGNIIGIYIGLEYITIIIEYKSLSILRTHSIF